jgi:hypothetical protein
LVLMFSNRQPLLVALRRQGLALLRRLPPLGGLVLRLMTRRQGRLQLLAPWLSAVHPRGLPQKP